MMKTSKIKLTFINQSHLWRILVPATGAVLLIIGHFFLENLIIGRLIQPLGMLLVFLPYLIPFKFKNVVRYSTNGINFKLNTGSSKAFRYSQIKYLEALENHLILWKSKKKSIKIDVSAYSKEDVNMLIDLLQLQKTKAIEPI
ncbi:hypothetical protein [Leeuwenhoekiella sp. MAR_2009_132]|uniref:hypothetical protein n=1 Tax=Leeuwenhoekiella sp. MAR_2009_132 TaxID=1392489 RepID=UPI000F66CAFA|nr:hypothetical protein [Leeuwenhoekiella sp. MAR_2009_132]